MAVTADDDVDAGHGFGEAHVVAIAVAPVLAFLHAAVAQGDDHVHLLGFAQKLHRLPGGLDGVGELQGGSHCVELGFLAEHPEDAEADATAFDHEVATDRPLLGEALQVGQRRRRFLEKSVFEASTAGARFALTATLMALPRPSAPRSNS